MPEKTKPEESDETSKTPKKKSKNENDDNWSKDQREKSYYYDDSYGYEIYDPDEEDAEDKSD